VSIPAINLSTTSAITVSLWANRTYSTVGGHTLLEDSANYNTSTTGFGIFPDDDTCQGIMIGVRGNAGFNNGCFSQPSSGVWHHLVVIFDKSQPPENEVTFYIDGTLQTPTQWLNASDNTNNFGNNRIYLFSRGGTLEFNAGRIDQLQIYSRALSSAEIQTLQ